MEDLNHLDSSEVLTEGNDQDLHIEEEINNQLDDSEDSEGQELATSDNDDETGEDSDDGKPTPEQRRRHAFKKQKDKLRAEKLENHRLRQEIAKLRGKKQVDPMAKYDPNKYSPEEWRNLQIRESVKSEMAQEKLARQEAQIEAKEDQIYAKEFDIKKQELIEGGAKDYDKVMADAQEVFIPQPAVDFIQESDNPPAIAYYLAKNRAQAEKLATMTPDAIRNYLNRVEFRLEAEAEKKAQVSKANATPKKGGKGGSPQKDRGKMGMKEYAEDYKRRRARSRGNR